jgi:hypothetical protein
MDGRQCDDCESNVPPPRRAAFAFWIVGTQGLPALFPIGTCTALSFLQPAVFSLRGLCTIMSRLYRPLNFMPVVFARWKADSSINLNTKIYCSTRRGRNGIESTVRQVRDWGSSNSTLPPRSRTSLRREFGDGGGSHRLSQRHRVLRSGANCGAAVFSSSQHQYDFSQIPLSICQCSHAVNRSDLYCENTMQNGVWDPTASKTACMQCHPIIQLLATWVILTSSNASVCPHFAPPVTSCLSFRTS